MEVFYTDDRLRALCTSFRDLKAKYGQVGATRVFQRLRFLEQADTLDDLFHSPGGCHPLGGGFKGGYYDDCYSFRLHQGWRLVFRIMSAEERKRAGATEESAIVIEIIDYHQG